MTISIANCKSYSKNKLDSFDETPCRLHQTLPEFIKIFKLKLFVDPGHNGKTYQKWVQRPKVQISQRQSHDDDAIIMFTFVIYFFSLSYAFFFGFRVFLH